METKPSLCMYFQVHQPDRLRQYRFFDIGNDSHYYDDFANRTIMRRIAEKCYLPMNAMLLQLIEANGGKFKVAFSIPGTAIEQMEVYAPDVLDGFRKLAATGCVEFLAETYSHSLASLFSTEEFEKQVKMHSDLIFEKFGVKPTCFRNTELIYSDAIGETVRKMGFTCMLTEGAKHILGWKSPNYVYTNAINPELKLLLRNFNLSDDIAFRFSDRSWNGWPMDAGKFASSCAEAMNDGEVLNLFMDYETFGEHQSAATGILDFMRYLPEAVIRGTDFEFCTPSEAAGGHRPVAPLNVPFPISWADEERDTTAWLGNELQDEASSKLYGMVDKVTAADSPALYKDFLRLQESDHFYYMCTKFFADGAVHNYFNPYDTPYEAFINYMNVLSDFILRVDKELKQ